MEKDDRPVGTRSVVVGGSVQGNIVTGDSNTVTYQQEVAADGIDIHAELASLQEALSSLTTIDGRKAQNALNEAALELENTPPDRDAVGSSLERALTFAKRAEGFAQVIELAKPSLSAIATWLGTHWDNILGSAGPER